MSGIEAPTPTSSTGTEAPTSWPGIDAPIHLAASAAASAASAASSAASRIAFGRDGSSAVALVSTACVFFARVGFGGCAGFAGCVGFAGCAGFGGCVGFFVAFFPRLRFAGVPSSPSITGTPSSPSSAFAGLFFVPRARFTGVLIPSAGSS
ncbi:hypothetical protein BD626DRAFT_476379 [Schizophyllum amplum]|uniref:Uncharacterized protein n=1 Tax=Schizophyllum amplum TaxID=97359 RepID=A0A550CZB3_9AGAR|nr:hypothetical protein BD626DRAFT_476379 [Auriculariopsis ampla]